MYERRGHMRAQMLVDFVNELSPNIAKEEISIKRGEWILLVDSSSNKKGSEAKIIIEGLGRVIVDQLVRFGFKASNNQAEYEALHVEIRLAKELRATRLMIKSDSQLITGQVNGEYQARDLQLIQYLEAVKEQAFEKFTLWHVPRKKNEKADLLAKLASTRRGGLNKTIVQEALGQPTVQEPAVLSSEWQLSWFDPIINHLYIDSVLDDPQEAKRIKRSYTKEASLFLCYGALGSGKQKKPWKKSMRGCVEAILEGELWLAKLCTRDFTS
ncbi:rnhA, partial [Mucuna pruriens]